MQFPRFDPPPAFYFNVMFVGSAIPPVVDMAFQSVDGLEVGFDTEPLMEGGDNTAVYALPKPASNSNLKLKRGLGLASSSLVYWCRTELEGGLSAQITTRSVVVMLLNAQSLPIAVWDAANAYPVKWTIGAFDAEENKIAVETIELAYSTLTRRT